jgi:hypothetical protein
MTTWTAKALPPNKANFPAGPEGARADADGSGLATWIHCAKQSQFPSCGKRWALAGKAASGTALGSTVQNKANWPVPTSNGQGQHQERCPGTMRAKQSQFLAEHEERQLLGRERVMMHWTAQGPSAKQSQLPCTARSGPGRQGRQQSCLGIKRAKQSQLASRARKWARGGNATGGTALGPSVRNKANSRGCCLRHGKGCWAANAVTHRPAGSGENS